MSLRTVALLTRSTVAGAAVLVGFSAISLLGQRPVAAATAALLPATQAGITPEAQIETESGAALSQTLAGIAASGATWIRLDLFWPNIEPSPGQFDWSEPDPVVAGAVADGLHVLLVPDYTPDWTKTPGDPAAYGAMMAAAVRHFAPMGVHTWEIWNEPNMSWSWGPQVSPAAYTATLKAGYSAVKAFDPSATVVAGALSPATDASDLSEMSPLSFLEGIYAAGGQGYFDALSVHPSSFPDMPTQADSWNTFYELPHLHQVMVDHGDGAKKIWLTEYGAPTGTASDAVSLQVQAQMISQAMQAVTAWPWAGPIFSYWQDAGSDPANDQDNFGMLTAAGVPKPSLAAYESQIAPATTSSAQVSSASAAGASSATSSASGATFSPSGSSSSPSGAIDHAGLPTTALVSSTGRVTWMGTPTCPIPSGGVASAAPVVALASTPDGHGCWMAASNGGVFSFGDASFYGSAGDIHLNQPVVGMSSTPDGGGYWLVTADGGVFSFGDASFHGSASGSVSPQPVVGMVATPDGGGYALFTANGRELTFGDDPAGATPAARPSVRVSAVASL